MANNLLELHRQECRIEGGAGPFWSAVLTDDRVFVVKHWEYRQTRYREFKVSREMMDDVSKVDAARFIVPLDAYESAEPAFGYRPYIFLSNGTRVVLWENELAGFLERHAQVKWWFERAQHLIDGMVGDR